MGGGGVGRGLAAGVTRWVGTTGRATGWGRCCGCAFACCKGAGGVCLGSGVGAGAIESSVTGGTTGGEALCSSIR
jgi:hypothetical protein